MKIKFRINKDIEDVQIDISAPRKTQEVDNIVKVLEDYCKDKLCVTKDGEIYELGIDDIICFFTEDKSVSLRTRRGIFRTKYRMYEIEEKYSFGFLRISNAVIVNKAHIKAFDVSRIDNIIVKLDDGTEEYVSKRRISKILKKLKEGRV